MVDFAVPLHPEDLETAKPGRFSVENVFDVEGCADIDSVIDDLSNKILNSKNIFATTLDNKVFDKIYSLIKFWSCHSGSTKQRVMELLCAHVQEVLLAVGEAPSMPPQGANLPEVAYRRAAFQAIGYMYATAVQVADKTSIPAGAMGGGTGGGGAKADGKGGKGGAAKGKATAATKKKLQAAAAEEEEEERNNEAAGGDEDGGGAAKDSSVFEWSSMREPCIRIMIDVLNADLRKLWSLGVPDEEFVSSFTKTGTRLVSSAHSMKDKEARRAVTVLLATACHKFPSVVTGTVSSLVDAAVKYDHAAACVADVAEAWGAPRSSTPAHHAVSQLLGELGRLNNGSGNGSDAAAPRKDAAGLRRAAALIMDVSERLPAAVLANMSVLLPYLDCDSYALRSALVTTLANIVAKSFNSATAAATANATSGAGSGNNNNDDDDDAEGGRKQHQQQAVNPDGTITFNTKTRDALLDVLLERAYDVHSYTRAAVLRGWCTLAQATAIPLERLPVATALAVDRLRDKASLVRKTAAQLLRALLENNPFGPRVDATIFASQMKMAEAWLGANAPEVWAHISKKDGTSSDTMSGGEKKKGLKTVREEGPDGGNKDQGNTEENDTEEDQDEALIAASAEEMQNEEDGGNANNSHNDGAKKNDVEVIVSPEAARCLRARDMCAAGIKFATSMINSIPIMVELLSSKTGSDVMEAIRFLSTARAFAVPGAESALARMLVLIWSEGPVREEVVRTFDKLYILNENLDDDAAGDGGAWGTGEAEVEDDTGAAGEQQQKDEGNGSNEGKSNQKKTAGAGEGEEEDTDNDEAEDEDENEAKSSGAKGGKRGAAAKKSTTATNAAAAAAAAATKIAPAATKKKAAPAPKPIASSSSSTTTISSARRDATVDPHAVAEALVRLLAGASLAVRTSLEEVIRACTERNLLPTTVFGCLWEMVAFGVASLARTRITVATHIATNAAAATPDAESSVISQIATSDTVLQRARAAMSILCMAATAAPETVDSAAGIARVHAVLSPLPIAGFPVGNALVQAVMTTEGLAQQIKDISILEPCLSLGDYRLARHACAALQRFQGQSLVSAKKSGAAAIAAEGGSATAKASTATATAKNAKAVAAAAAEKETLEQKRTDTMIAVVQSIASMIQGDWDGGDIETPHWYAAAQQGIDAIFAVAAQPVAICTLMLQTMASGALLSKGDGSDSSTASSSSSSSSSSPQQPLFTSSMSRTRLGRLFFVLGHVAVKILVHIEALASRVKLLRIRASEKAEHAHANEDTSSATNASAAAAAKKKGATTTASAPTKGGGAEGGGGGKNSAANDGIEEQLGVNAAEDEKEAELVVLIADKELAATNLGGLFAPLLVHMANTLLHSGGGEIEADVLIQSALLALCKLCAVSADFCEKHLQILFTVLSHARSPRIRSVVVIALGDLAFRFPNLVEPYTSHLYARLRDGDAGVRKNTLMVLTHLILNDMVKVKGQVGEIAICLNDSEQRIADLTRLFFTELSKRPNNPIYNILPDTLSCLSKLANDPPPATGTAASAVKPLDAATFRDVVKFLLGFINKDKQAESLAEKLLHRFEASDDVPLWRDVAYCLSQLPMTEQVARKLAEHVRDYKRALADNDVWDSFCFMLVRARKLAGSGTSNKAATASSSAASLEEGGESGTSSSSSSSSSSAPKGELRGVVDAWENALNEGRSGASEDDTALNNARAAARRARRIADVEGIDASAITAQAVAAAAEKVSAAQAAAAAEAEAAKKQAKGVVKKTTTSAATTAPAAAAATDAKPKKKGLVVDSDDENVDATASAKTTKTSQSKRSTNDDDDDDDDIITSKKKPATKATAPSTAAKSSSTSSKTASKSTK